MADNKFAEIPKMKRSADCADYPDFTGGLAILVKSSYHFNQRTLCNLRIKPICNLRNGLLAMLALATSAPADPGKDPGAASPAPSSSPYAIVDHLGETERQVTQHEDRLLAHRRTIDPFGVAMRGKFKGLPPVAPLEQHPAAATNVPAQTAKAVIPKITLENAIQQLQLGGVNIANHEALIGFRSVHEGDLMVLELSGQQFVVWVESIDRRGVQFCDIKLQHHTLKRFRFGPTELPESSATGQTDVRDFLKEDGN